MNSEIITGGDAWSIDFNNIASNNGSAYSNWVDIAAYDTVSLPVSTMPRYVLYGLSANGVDDYQYITFYDVAKNNSVRIIKGTSATSFTVSVVTGASNLTVTSSSISYYNSASTARSVGIVAFY